MFESAIAQLEVSAATCENNAPIWEAEGNQEQAATSRQNAEDYRAAIQVLSVRAMERANFGCS